MNKKILIISVVVMAVMIIGVGSALAFNGNSSPTLEDKLEAIEERVDDGSMDRDQADEIITEISVCDGDCDESGECTLRPEEGRGIFGNGAQDGTGYCIGNGQNREQDCDGTCDGDALADGNCDGDCDSDSVTSADGLRRGCGRNR